MSDFILFGLGIIVLFIIVAMAVNNYMGDDNE